MVRNPKQAFLESQHRATFEKLTEQEAFRVACEYAMLEMVAEMPDPGDPSKAWDSACKIAGARRLLDILATLHQAPPEMKSVKPPTLNYKV
jgi:hypothetical protein